MKERDCVSEARAALKAYQETKDLDALRAIPPDSIDRYDVWLCVFEGEENKPAYKVLQEKDTRKMFMDVASDGELGIKDLLAITILSNLRGEGERPYALTPLEGLQIIVDCMGKEHLRYILEGAEWMVKTRTDIVAKNPMGNNRWLGFAIEIRDMIANYIKENP